MEVTIEKYQPAYKKDFIRLNTEWIKSFFHLEASDLYTFEHLEEYILDKGGQIFLAVAPDGSVQGCCALIPHPDKDAYELAKMAVSPSAQGSGIGRKLGEALINDAKMLHAKRIFLEGNTRLEASIALYRKLGFREIPLRNNAYERCDILMELLLE